MAVVRAAPRCLLLAFSPCGVPAEDRTLSISVEQTLRCVLRRGDKDICAVDAEIRTIKSPSWGRWLSLGWAIECVAFPSPCVAGDRGIGVKIQRGKNSLRCSSTCSSNPVFGRRLRYDGS